MHLEINSRGNGACPFCSHAENCHVHEAVKEKLDKVFNEDDIMEMVFYSCPHFDEKQ